ncbi:LPS translocon maturation chaperone LptM [Aggregatibacter kilianii]|nr:lipoprotein [Aggregatibacter kilianii]
MKKLISLFLLVTLCALSSGCGVKGPLYFPEQDSADQATK